MERQPVEFRDIINHFKPTEGRIGAAIGLGLGILVMEGSLQRQMGGLRWNEIQAYRLGNLMVETLAPIAGFYMGIAVKAMAEDIRLPIPKVKWFRRKKYKPLKDTPPPPVEVRRAA